MLNKIPRIVIIPHVGISKSHLLRAIALKQLLKGISHTKLIVPSKAAKFCAQYFPSLECEWIPWNFGHNDVLDCTLSEMVSNSRESGSAIERIFHDFAPDIVIGIPGYYTSMLCRVFKVRHISILHGPWLTPEYELTSLNKGEKKVFQQCDRLYEIIEVITAIIMHALGYTSTSYREWLEKECIWVAQDFSTQLKTSRPKIGFLSQDFGSMAALPNDCLVLTFGTAIPGIVRRVISAASKFDYPVVAVSEIKPTIKSNFIWLSATNMTDVTKRSKIVINQGGISTVGKFANALVPQIFLPYEIDAAVNSILAIRSGFGKSVNFEQWQRRTPLGRIAPQFGNNEIDRLIELTLTVHIENPPHLNDKAMISDALISALKET